MDGKTLESRLKEFSGVTEVLVEGDARLVARILVPGWNDVDEADRQEAIWAFLRERFTEDELKSIEFILTNAPTDAPAA